MRDSVLITAVCYVAGAASLCAQAPERGYSIELTKSTDSRSASYGSMCLRSCQGGDVLSPLSFTTIEIELAQPLADEGWLGFDYHARLVPVAHVRGNPDRAALRSGSAWTMSSTTERSSVLGAGIKPVGARLWAGRAAARLEADLAVGVLAFMDPLFAANASRINFALEAGIGARIARFVFGYRRHHVSNAGLGEVNPGLDSSVIFLGFSF